MKRRLLATAAIIALAATPAFAQQTMGTSPTGVAPTISPCVSNQVPPSARINRSGNGSASKPGSGLSWQGTGNSSLGYSGTSTAPNTASGGTAC
jgi:hypothetical protein